ncbi:MAG: DUF4364 family protein [Lachnospiraceae bacterium]|jgi:hypothetical protein
MAYSGQALYKLMILYMLDQVSYPLSNNQIVDFILNHGYTDYFHVQEAMTDLNEANHIHSEEHIASTLYEITSEGQKTIRLLSDMIDPGIKREINDYLKENSFSLRSESGVRVDYKQTLSGEYAVHCSIIEADEVIFDMTINVMSKEDVDKIYRDFKSKSQSLYMTVMKTLLS